MLFCSPLNETVSEKPDHLGENTMRLQRFRSRKAKRRQPLLEGLETRLCPSGYLLVDSYDNNSVLRYDENTGAFVDTLVPKGSGGLDNSVGMVLGPDHNLYVSNHLEPINNGNGQTSSVLSFDGTTGSFRGVILDGSQVSSPRGIVFGPDGNLYVAEGLGPGTVLQVSLTTGNVADFVPTSSGGLAHPTSMVFGPDGSNDGKLDLYVGKGGNGVLRYDGTTGAFKGTFVTSGAGGLGNAWALVFGPDGNLYVSNNVGTSNQIPPGSILRYEGPAGPNPGAFLDTFVPTGSGGLNTPLGLLFGPDVNGDGQQDLYVASASLDTYNFTHAHPGTSEVLIYDGSTGAFLKTIVTPDSGGLRNPSFMVFTQTDPVTLNYDGAATTSITAASHSASAVPAAGTPTPIILGPILPTWGALASPAVGPAVTESASTWRGADQRVSTPNRVPAPRVAHRTLLRASLDITGRPARQTVRSDPVHDRKPGWTVTALW
jgi:hypothetical protein